METVRIFREALKKVSSEILVVRATRKKQKKLRSGSEHL
jgi:hypothetical protein